ncbi:MAG TPA: efflux RND transporter periplasmic adaptor subunit [Anaeromyxobacteraceae bacterium]|nr:efflux RND transporter periplasmic adaptor subunit [Anaeromyxobacteraceae bacterium]
MDKLSPQPRSPKVPAVIAGGTAVVIGLGALLYLHARGETNSVALASSAKPVTVVEARASAYRAERRYVGTIEPWFSAQVGPQLIAAYVDTVLVRPGAAVARGQVIATLDCRNASASNKAVAMQARALETTQAALADKAARMSTLLSGGFAAPDEVEMNKAESEAKQAQMLGAQAQMLGATLQVQDCVLRAPFDGEVSERHVDPGAFVRPGSSIATVLDRRMVRLTAEIPENDFGMVAPGTPVQIHLLAVDRDLKGTITRRAPGADSATRTIHVEIDLPNADRSLPAGTTAELRLAAGQPQPSTEIPLSAASVRGKKATVLVVEGEVARKRTYEVRGERGGSLFVEPALQAGALVVTEGRGSLSEGDRVAPAREGAAAAEGGAKPPAGSFAETRPGKKKGAL